MWLRSTLNPGKHSALRGAADCECQPPSRLTSGITAKPAIRYHFKTGQTELIQNKSSYTSQTFVVQIFCS
jgi:hypothetical protein